MGPCGGVEGNLHVGISAVQTASGIVPATCWRRLEGEAVTGAYPAATLWGRFWVPTLASRRCREDRVVFFYSRLALPVVEAVGVERRGAVEVSPLPPQPSRFKVWPMSRPPCLLWLRLCVALWSSKGDNSSPARRRILPGPSHWRCPRICAAWSSAIRRLCPASCCPRS